jgi:hypothetical protein
MHRQAERGRHAQTSRERLTSREGQAERGRHTQTSRERQACTDKQREAGMQHREAYKKTF